MSRDVEMIDQGLRPLVATRFALRDMRCRLSTGQVDERLTDGRR
jgi:hypothetical protein